MGVIIGAVSIAISVVLLFSFSKGLHTPESSQCYNGKVYVSNIGNLPPDREDGDGYISVLSLDGKLLKRHFVTGLNAPKGIAFLDGKLFVADINRIVVADAESGRIVRTVKVPGAKFLNDVVTNGREIYISDTQTNTIYSLDPKNYRISVYLKSSAFEGPNGIAFRKGKLIVVSWGGGKVLEVDGNKKIHVLASGFESLDGVVVTSDGTILFSDFSAGKVYALKDGKVREILRGLVSPADIGFCNGKLFVPQFFMNSVKVYKLRD